MLCAYTRPRYQVSGHVTTKKTVFWSYLTFLFSFFQRLSIGPFDFLECFIALRYLIYLFIYMTSITSHFVTLCIHYALKIWTEMVMGRNGMGRNRYGPKRLWAEMVHTNTGKHHIPETLLITKMH